MESAILVKDLTKVFSYVVSLDPLSYGVDGIRGSLTGITHYGLELDFVILSLLTVLIMVIGSYLFPKI